MTKNRETTLPEPSTLTKVELCLAAPEAEQVLVTGSFCSWVADSVALNKGKKGLWKTTLSLAPGRYEYRFIVDGKWCDDPNCTERVPNEFGTENCVLHVAAIPKSGRTTTRSSKKT
jgi:1,4-alpha-glucan branching enzyme